MKRTIIGLTGGIACGKSTVAEMLEELGAHIIDADQVARDVVQPGSVVFSRIVEAFGPGVVNSQGELDRAALGRLVFADERLRDKLNALIHPAIWSELLHQCKSSPHEVVVLMAPLLYEHGGERHVDRVWVVAVPRQVQLERLQARNHLSLEEAEARVKSQWPIERKVELADLVIDNSGGRDATREQVVRAWHALKLKT